MSIEAKLFTAFSGLVGADSDGLKCCYPVTLPQKPVYPAIVYQVTSCAPSALTQVARFSDFVVLVTLFSQDKAGINTLRASVLAAAEAMPEYKTHNELGDGYDFEPKTYTWKTNFEFRNSET